MSEFDELFGELLDFMGESVGTLPFTIGDQEYQADLDQSVIERGDLGEGGVAVIRSARLVTKRSQFEVEPKFGVRVSVDGQTLRLTHIAKDSASYTLTLADVNH